MASRPARAGIPKPVAGYERILEACLPLFAQAGFAGVSMRDVAQEVGVTPAALYYHFRDKEDLYLAAVGHAFATRLASVLAEQLPPGEPWGQLEAFVTRVCTLLAADPDLQRLIQWVLLDTDAARAEKLVEAVFRPFYVTVAEIAGQACPGCDVHRFAVSVFSLIVFPFESRQVVRFLPGYQPPHEQPEALARHVIGLLHHGLQPLA